MTPVDTIVPAARAVLEHARAVLAPEHILRIGVGVSGGEDSIALMNVLDRIRREAPLEIFVLHFNHKLRVQSDSDEAFVRKSAQLINASFRSGSPDVLYDGTENLEAWAREARYAFFEQQRRQENLHAIATAHHMHDRAETLLFRLITGRLATSSVVMREVDPERKIIRPFLKVPKGAIQEFVQYEKLDFVFDESNDDCRRSRNWIRHRLFPELEKVLNPGLSDSLNEVAIRLLDDEDSLRAAAKLLAQKIRTGSEIVKLEPALRWRVLQELCESHVGPDARKLGYRALSEVVENLKQETTLGKDIGHGIRVEVDTGGTVRFKTSERNGRA